MKEIGLKISFITSVIGGIVILTSSFLVAPIQSSIFTFVFGSVVGAHLYRKIKNNSLVM